MNKFFFVVAALFLFSCGEDEGLLKDGKYNVSLVYAVDYAIVPSLKGETRDQVWEFKDNQVILFKKAYDLQQERNYYRVDVAHGDNVTHVEIYPGNKKEGFGGFWYSDYPGLWITIADFEGKRQSEK